MCAHPFAMRPVDVKSMTTFEFDQFASAIDGMREGVSRGD